MALPASGQISLGDIAGELGIPLSNLDIGGLANTFNIPTDPDSISEFYSKNAWTISISSPVTDSGAPGSSAWTAHWDITSDAIDGTYKLKYNWSISAPSGATAAIYIKIGAGAYSLISSVAPGTDSGVETTGSISYNEVVKIQVALTKTGAIPGGGFSIGTNTPILEKLTGTEPVSQPPYESLSISLV